MVPRIAVPYMENKVGENKATCVYPLVTSNFMFCLDKSSTLHPLYSNCVPFPYFIQNEMLKNKVIEHECKREQYLTCSFTQSCLALFCDFNAHSYIIFILPIKFRESFHFGHTKEIAFPLSEIFLGLDPEPVVVISIFWSSDGLPHFLVSELIIFPDFFADLFQDCFQIWVNNLKYRTLLTSFHSKFPLVGCLELFTLETLVD